MLINRMRPKSDGNCYSTSAKSTMAVAARRTGLRIEDTAQVASRVRRKDRAWAWVHMDRRSSWDLRRLRRFKTMVN
jgi:hypothetical protein